MRIDLLQMLGDAPEGPWAIFSLPEGDGTAMVSVLIPRSLWMRFTREDPFSSEIGIMEAVGRRAIQRRLTSGRMGGPIIVDADDAGLTVPPKPWYRVLRICGKCGQEVPPGEVLEGLGNALPPNARGDIELKVLCPMCQVQTPHRMSPWEIFE